MAEAKDDYKIIVEKSTVPVYTNAWIRRVMEQNGAPRARSMSPLTPSFCAKAPPSPISCTPTASSWAPTRNAAPPSCANIYEPLTNGDYQKRPDAIPRPDAARVPAEIIVTSAKSAELIKHASNAFLAMKISFINAVANICESVGADVQQVREGIGADSRIGRRFLNPGIGYGGSCFPKDLKAFHAVAREFGFDFRLLDEVIRINEEQRHRFLRKIRSTLWTLKASASPCLASPLKAVPTMCANRPPSHWSSRLIKEGCEIVAYDPAAMEKAREFLDSSVTFAESSYAAAHKADALLILTDWEEFAALDLDRMKTALKFPIIIDGRNLYAPKRWPSQDSPTSALAAPDAAPHKSAVKAPRA